MDSISETRLEPLNPVFANRVRSLAEALGFDIRITQGLRTSAEQDALYSQGRLALNLVNEKRLALKWAPLTVEQNVKVTNAAPGQSWHEYGMAVDVVPMEPTPDWNLSHPQWAKIVEMTPQFKLKDGISWKDEPHLQPAEIPTSPTDNYNTSYLSYKQILDSQGLQGVWDYARLQT